MVRLVPRGLGGLALGNGRSVRLRELLLPDLRDPRTFPELPDCLAVDTRHRPPRQERTGHLPGRNARSRQVLPDLASFSTLDTRGSLHLRTGSDCPVALRAGAVASPLHPTENGTVRARFARPGSDQVDGQLQRLLNGVRQRTLVVMTQVPETYHLRLVRQAPVILRWGLRRRTSRSRLRCTRRIGHWKG